jgi:alpha-beta hydrolase superfamily lysophospholipase
MRMGTKRCAARAGAEPIHDVPGSIFEVRADDGVVIRGVRFPGPTTTAFVLGHGFCGSRRSVAPLARKLALRGTVYALDFRGHGSSEGLTTLGNLEALDVHAVVELARAECPSARVVTIGASMGGIAVLREAACFGASDAVVSISAPAEWMGQQRRARLLGKLVTSRLGRAAAKRFMNTRIEPLWMSPPPPVELVADIRVPMLIVHGATDPYVDPAQAKRLHDASGNRASLRVISRYGHAEAGFDERVVALIDDEIASLVTT